MSGDDEDINIRNTGDGEIIHGTRNTFVDKIGGLKYGAKMEDIIVMSDKRQGDQLYPVYRDWIDINTGLVHVPRADRKKDSEQIYQYLIEKRCAPNTITLPWLIGENNGKVIQVRLGWTKYCIKVLYKDFALGNLLEAYNWIDCYGSIAGDDKTEDNFSDDDTNLNSKRRMRVLHDFSKKSKMMKTDLVVSSHPKIIEAKNAQESTSKNRDLIPSPHNRINTIELGTSENSNTNETVLHPMEETILEFSHDYTDLSNASTVNTENTPANSTLSVDGGMTLSGYSGLSDIFGNVTHKSSNVITPISVRANEAERHLLTLITQTLAKVNTLESKVNQLIQINTNLSEIISVGGIKAFSAPSVSITSPRRYSPSLVRTPLALRLKRELKFPLRNLEALKQFDEKIDIAKPQYEADTRENLKKFLYTFNPNHRDDALFDILDVIFDRSICESVNIGIFISTAFYILFEEYVSTWDKILPIVGDKSVWKRKSRAWQIKRVIQRWLRSKKQTVKRQLLKSFNGNSKNAPKENETQLVPPEIEDTNELPLTETTGDDEVDVAYNLLNSQ